MGNEVMRPAGLPEEPSEQTAIEVQSPAGVPWSQSRTWSTAEFAADAAEDDPRASIIAAPRFCTVGMKSSSIQAWSLTTSAAIWSAVSAWRLSGYGVAAWQH